MKCNQLSLILIVICLFTLRTHAQDQKTPAPMMDTMAVKKKMMEPEMMKNTQRAMMSDKSMVPSMMAKEMMMQEMMQDEKTISMVNKATMADGADKPMMDGPKMKMAEASMMKDDNQLQMLFQELVARHLAAQKMKMMAKAPVGDKAMPKAMAIEEKSMMEGKKEMMTGDAMVAMLVKETMIQALMKDAEVLALVEKQAQMMQESAVAKMISDENTMMKSEAMAKDPNMVKEMTKEMMVRQLSGAKGMKKKEMKK